MTAIRSWKEPGLKKILAVRLDAMGDVLMTEPALRAIKSNIPGAELSLLVSPQGKAVASMLPEVDRIVSWEAPWMKATAAVTDSRNDRQLISLLASAEYDAAVIFTVYSQSALPAALCCYLADIPLRLAWCRENPYHLLTDWARELEPDRIVRHEVERHLALLASVGITTKDSAIRMEIGQKDAQTLQQKLSSAGIERPFIVVHPGASAASRRWPVARFRAAAQTLAAESGCRIVVTGSPGEIELCEQVVSAQPQIVSLAGRLTLPELSALIQQAALLICNNSGPAHIAAAVRTPVVVLYALTNPQHTPWQAHARVLFHDVPCRFCYKSVCPLGHHRCLEGVTVGEVVSAANELLCAETSSELFRSVIGESDMLKAGA